MKWKAQYGHRKAESRFLWSPVTKLDDFDQPETRWLCWARFEYYHSEGEWVECKWWSD